MEGSKSLGTNSTSSIHQSCATSNKHPRKQSIVEQRQVKLPHLRYKIEDRSEDETEKTRAIRPRSRMKTCHKIFQLRGNVSVSVVWTVQAADGSMRVGQPSNIKSLDFVFFGKFEKGSIHVLTKPK